MSFSFGTPSGAPASTGLSSGFSFGANKPTTSGFGLTATSQTSTGLFGSTPATSAPAFGTATSGFGTTSAFGTNTAATAFGTTATPALGTASTAPAFGASATPSFGASTSLFGTTTTSSFSLTTTSFATTTTPSFGTALGTGSLSFGTSSNTSLSTGLNFGAQTTAATSTGLGGLGGFGLSTTTTTQSTGFGLLGATSTATTSTCLFGAKLGGTTLAGTLPSTTGSSSLGLGGVAPSGIGATNTTNGKTEPPKQTKLPNEIITTVESFKEFVKKQKSLSSDVMRLSIKPLHKVSSEAEATLRAVISLSSEVVRARAQSRRLRSAAAAALAAADTVARDPPGTALEGSAPPLYVKELISELEQQLIAFRRQMDVADKQMQSSPKLLTEQELTLGIRRMHESLVALAGRLQAVHTQVEAQKEQYLNLRKYILKDPTNVFDTPATSTSLDQILKDAEGSRKKSRNSGFSDVGLTSAVLSDPKAALSNVQQLAGPTPFSYLGTTLSPFPVVESSGTSWQPQQTSKFAPSVKERLGTYGTPSTEYNNSSFQLQKPPGKRGKQ